MKSYLPTLALVAASLASASPNLVVTLKSGLKAETDVAQIARVTFSSTALTVHPRSGSPATTPLAGIQRIDFSPASSIRFAGGKGRGFLAEGGRGSVTLRLDAATRIEADLLDLRGNRVLGLGVSALPAGEHRLSWSAEPGAANLPGGLYLLRVRAEGRAPEHVLVPWMP
jgi:hypothetical protein